MNIELSGTAHIQKAAGSGDSAHVKGKTRAAGDAGGPQAGGFLSLLSSLEADAGVAAAGGAQDGEAALPGLGGEKPQLTESLAADPALQLTGLLPADPAVQLPTDPAMLLAQSLQSVGRDAVAQPSAVAAAELPNGAAKGLPAGSRLATVAAAVETPDTRAGAAAVLLPAQPESAKPSSSDLFKKAMKTLSDNMPKARSGDASSGVGNAVSDWRALKPTSIADGSSRSSSLPEAMVAAGNGDAGARPAGRFTEKSAIRQVGGSPEGFWGPPALLAGGRIDAPAAMTEASMLPPEVLVAEQVKYWISSDVQNAELKLDGFGPDPVEVSISLQGNEAHVAFRSDQAETRQVLENAVSHLKGLLESEGLVLSGVSVGASGHDGQGSQEERRGRPGGRQTTVMTLEPVPADGLSRASRSSGRAVDLFV